MRSSCQDVFCRKGVLKNFVEFSGEHQRQSLLFNKVAGLRSATLLKKRLRHRCFLVNFAKFLETRFIIDHLRWLLLKLINGTLSFTKLSNKTSGCCSIIETLDF